MSGGVLRQVGRFGTAPAGCGNAGTAVARTEAPPAWVDMDTACCGFAQCSDLAVGWTLLASQLFGL